jgi:hypothetical protein
VQAEGLMSNVQFPISRSVVWEMQVLDSEGVLT